MSDDEFQADSIALRLQSASLQEKPAAACAACEKRARQESQDVSVQCRLPVETGKGENPTVSVPLVQLAAMRKFYMAVKSACFGLGDGEPGQALQQLFDRVPEVLNSVDRQGRSPIECALAQRRWTAASQLLEIAVRANPRALRRRNARGEDVLMLAVSAGGEAVVRQLLGLGFGRSACVHYNLLGRNVLHLCALDSSDAVLEAILAELDNLLSRGELKPDAVTSALCTCDSEGSSALHYMAQKDRSGMLRAVLAFAQSRLPDRLDWDVQQTGGDRLTPLALAASVDAAASYDLLLQEGLAGINLAEHASMWAQLQLSDAVRNRLSQHCRLLGPLSALPAGRLQELQDGLQKLGLSDEFLLRLRTHWPNLPQLPVIVLVLTVCESFSGSCRLVAWCILKDLGQAADLASLLES